MTEYTVITDAAGLADAAAMLSVGSGPVAVDVERASGFRYSQRAYLIQVFRRGSGVFLLDPPAIGSFAELQAVIGDEEWVLHAACREAAGWPRPLTLAINLSPAQFRDGRIVDTVQLALQRSGLPSARLELEITESLLLQDNAATLSTLHRLRGLGDHGHRHTGIDGEREGEIAAEAHADHAIRPASIGDM